jgi:hypothetical protein
LSARGAPVNSAGHASRVEDRDEAGWLIGRLSESPIES